jgi:phage terminase large subunit-like protein
VKTKIKSSSAKRPAKKKSNTSNSAYWFDKNAADVACEFFRKFLVHIKGEWAGRPLDLAKWQEDEVIRPLFGWKRKSDNLRRYRTCYVEIPRKNGKSTLGAGIALYLLFCDGEPGAEIYSAAGDRDQAAIIFELAKEMVDASPKLKQRSETYRRSITAPRASSYKVLSADAPTKHGLNPHGVIFDELHTQPNRHLWDVLITGTGARRQPVTFVMTTAGYDRNSICWEVHDYACKVRDRIIQDDSFLSVVFGAGDDDDWTSPKTWKKANPNLGTSVKLGYLETECKQAQEQPAKENTFKRLHLNIWTEQAVRWMPMEKWDGCNTPFSADELVGEQCFAGLDLASTTDIAALSILFPPTDDRPKWCNLWRFYVPEDSVTKRSMRDRVPYDQWVKQGFICATPGNVTDYDFIERDVLEIAERHQLVELAYDRWNATQLVTHLQDKLNTRDRERVVPFGQGFASMRAPTQELMKLVLGDVYTHGGNPVARWMASNVAVKQDPAGNLKPDKDKSTERIDGIVATIMALGRAMVTPNAGPSVYEGRGLIVI